ncbi:DUF320 domain-containing protein [Streptomyces sp. HUCO-GS316]|uniref:chaplin n=1 Tax=Streptomyces sp. HUCO-GS316 TaxID=2692198 RepID=UPI0013FFE896|nr:chaplin [Streptomyces sp. HUCO-GS316]MXM66002.1 DUF320 domain-containing protein [Streptomyces sp. HUCO-GS316]
MRRVTRIGVIAVVAASGAMAATTPVSAAVADDGGAGADGAAAGSPGLISGNTVQVPVHVPVNVCGNTMNVVGLLNPVADNSCVNADDGGAGTGTASGGTASGGAVAQGGGQQSAGVGSGNVVQLPLHVPVNVSGNTVDVVGVGSGAVGNESLNTSGNRPVQQTPRPVARTRTHPVPHAPHTTALSTDSLAHTGADQIVPALIGSAALILGGATVYRRSRPRPVR